MITIHIFKQMRKKEDLYDDDPVPDPEPDVVPEDGNPEKPVKK